MNPIDFFIEFYKKFEEGQIILCTGTHVLKVKTRSRPKQVWLGEDEVNGIPVCGGSVNMYGITLDEDGFVLYAEVTSNTASIPWQAILENK